VSNGLGSDAFCILWDGKQLHGLNAQRPAPKAWTPEYFQQQIRPGSKNPPKRGIDSVTVPGAVASWMALSERYGKLPFADLLEPAIEIAERGYLMPIVVQQKWAAATPELGSLPGFARSLPALGPRARGRRAVPFPAAARALKLIAETKGEAFYRGEIAEALARFSEGQGGSHAGGPRLLQARMGEADRAGLPRLHAARDPAQRPGHRRADRAGHPGKFDLASHAVDGIDSQHLQIEAMKLAFADVYRYVRRPASHGGDARADARRRLPGQPRA
jgi:gamma-glutamyltranspeptidase/glutathione hydrolase